MAPIRMSGMNSGLDTESIVKALVSGYDQKKQKIQKNQTKLEWSQEIWKGINTKVKSLYTGLDKVRFSGSYKSKKTTVSDQTKATISAGTNAVNGTQKLKITKMAQAGYLTGGKITGNNDDKVTSSTKLSSLGIKEGSSITVSAGGKETDITIDEDMSVKDFVGKLQEAGVNASFDESNARFFISAKDSGASNDFTLTGNGDNGIAALQSLGLYTKTDEDVAEYVAIKNQATLNADGTLDEAKTREALTTQYNKYKAAYSEALESATTTLPTQKSGLTDEMTGLTEGMTGLTDEMSTLSEEKAAIDSDATAREKIVNYLSDKTLVAQRLQAAGDDESAIAALGNDEEYQTAKANVEAMEERVANGEETHAEIAYQVNQAKAYTGNVDKLSGFLRHNTNKLTDYQSQAAAKQAEIDTKQEEIDAKQAEIDAKQAEIDDVDTQIAEANKTMADTVKELKATGLYDDISDDLDSVSVEDAVDAAINTIKSAIAEIDAPNVGGATRIKGQDAEIYLNGAQFTSETNNFDINGLSINLTGVTGDDEITITTSTDTDAIYDKVKDFLEQYNSIVNELQGLYNADSAKDYEPLTDDEKAEMNDTEIEKWETKIKDSLLRRDSTLGGVISTMTTAMSKSYDITMKDGTVQNMALSSVGIHTLGFLNATKNEQYAYHIDGDEDDTNTSGYSDKLRSMIESDPDAVASLLSQVAQGLYSALDTKIGAKTTELSSAYTLYNDKQMKSQAEKYTKDIKQWETRIADMEESYYKKFTAMEKSLANLNSSQSALTGMIG